MEPCNLQGAAQAAAIQQGAHSGGTRKADTLACHFAARPPGEKDTIHSTGYSSRKLIKMGENGRLTNVELYRSLEKLRAGRIEESDVYLAVQTYIPPYGRNPVGTVARKYAVVRTLEELADMQSRTPSACRNFEEVSLKQRPLKFYVDIDISLKANAGGTAPGADVHDITIDDIRLPTGPIDGAAEPVTFRVGDQDHLGCAQHDTGAGRARVLAFHDRVLHEAFIPLLVEGFREYVGTSDDAPPASTFTPESFYLAHASAVNVFDAKVFKASQGKFSAHIVVNTDHFHVLADRAEHLLMCRAMLEWVDRATAEPPTMLVDALTPDLRKGLLLWRQCGALDMANSRNGNSNLRMLGSCKIPPDGATDRLRFNQRRHKLPYPAFEKQPFYKFLINVFCDEPGAPRAASDRPTYFVKSPLREALQARSGGGFSQAARVHAGGGAPQFRVPYAGEFVYDGPDAITEEDRPEPTFVDVKWEQRADRGDCVSEGDGAPIEQITPLIVPMQGHGYFAKLAAEYRDMSGPLKELESFTANADLSGTGLLDGRRGYREWAMFAKYRQEVVNMHDAHFRALFFHLRDAVRTEFPASEFNVAGFTDADGAAALEAHKARMLSHNTEQERASRALVRAGHRRRYDVLVTQKAKITKITGDGRARRFCPVRMACAGGGHDCEFWADCIGNVGVHCFGCSSGNHTLGGTAMGETEADGRTDVLLLPTTFVSLAGAGGAYRLPIPAFIREEELCRLEGKEGRVLDYSRLEVGEYGFDGRYLLPLMAPFFPRRQGPDRQRALREELRGLPAYIARDEDAYATIVLKAPMGTGKTTVITSFLKEMRSMLASSQEARQRGVYDEGEGGRGMLGQGSSGKLRVLIIDYRVVLKNIHIRQWARDENMGAHAMQETEVVCINSLLKVNSAEPFDVLILDESESILAVLHESTTSHNNMKIAAALVKRATEARIVIVADAFISSRTLGFLAHTRSRHENGAVSLAPELEDAEPWLSKIPNLAVHHLVVPDPGLRYNIHFSKAGFTRTVIEQVHRMGNRAFVVTSKRTFAEAGAQLTFASLYGGEEAIDAATRAMEEELVSEEGADEEEEEGEGTAMPVSVDRDVDEEHDDRLGPSSSSSSSSSAAQPPSGAGAAQETPASMATALLDQVQLLLPESPVLLITGPLMTPGLRERLTNDANAAVRGRRAVFASPALGAGVDISDGTVFEFRAAMHEHGSCGVRETLQLHGRLRRCVQRQSHLYFRGNDQSLPGPSTVFQAAGDGGDNRALLMMRELLDNVYRERANSQKHPLVSGVRFLQEENPDVRIIAGGCGDAHQEARQIQVESQLTIEHWMMLEKAICGASSENPTDQEMGFLQQREEIGQTFGVDFSYDAIAQHAAIKPSPGDMVFQRRAGAFVDGTGALPNRVEFSTGIRASVAEQVARWQEANAVGLHRQLLLRNLECRYSALGGHLHNLTRYLLTSTAALRGLDAESDSDTSENIPSNTTIRHTILAFLWVSGAFARAHYDFTALGIEYVSTVPEEREALLHTEIDRLGQYIDETYFAQNASDGYDDPACIHGFLRVLGTAARGAPFQVSADGEFQEAFLHTRLAEQRQHLYSAPLATSAAPDTQGDVEADEGEGANEGASEPVGAPPSAPGEPPIVVHGGALLLAKCAVDILRAHPMLQQTLSNTREQLSKTGRDRWKLALHACKTMMRAMFGVSLAKARSRECCCQDRGHAGDCYSIVEKGEFWPNLERLYRYHLAGSSETHIYGDHQGAAFRGLGGSLRTSLQSFYHRHADVAQVYFERYSTAALRTPGKSLLPASTGDALPGVVDSYVPAQAVQQASSPSAEEVEVDEEEEEGGDDDDVVELVTPDSQTQAAGAGGGGGTGVGLCALPPSRFTPIADFITSARKRGAIARNNLKQGKIHEDLLRQLATGDYVFSPPLCALTVSEVCGSFLNPIEDHARRRAIRRLQERYYRWAIGADGWGPQRVRLEGETHPTGHLRFLPEKSAAVPSIAAVRSAVGLGGGGDGGGGGGGGASAESGSVGGHGNGAFVVTNGSTSIPGPSASGYHAHAATEPHEAMDCEEEDVDWDAVRGLGEVGPHQLGEADADEEAAAAEFDVDCEDHVERKRRRLDGNV